jgi:hypothetical protein
LTQEIFGGQAENTPEQTPQVPSDQQTPELLATRMAEKDNFIVQLKSENAQMREVVKQFDPLKLELQSLKAELSTLKGAGQPMAAVSQDDIKSLVQGAIKDAETERSASQNVKKATDDFAALFAGDYAKAAEAVQAKAAKLGLSPDWLKGVAAKSPSAFLRLMTDAEAPATSAENGSKPFVQGTVNAQALAHNQNVGVLKVGTKPYYDDMMKKNPSKYFTPKTQLELMDAARKGTYWS